MTQDTIVPKGIGSHSHNYVTASDGTVVFAGVSSGAAEAWIGVS